MSAYLYRYRDSKSGALLARYLGIPLMDRLAYDEGSVIPDFSQIINWGAASLPFSTQKMWLINNPVHVEKVSDKLTYFTTLGNIEEIPEWTTDQQEAQKWVNGGETVFCRNTTTGNNGHGITLVNEGQIPLCPLYTKLWKSTREWRVHCFRDSVIQVDIKLRMNDHNPSSVQNHDNGYLLSHKTGEKHGRPVPTTVIDTAMMIHEKTGLDFAAFDVGFNERTGHAKVYEGNSAPALDEFTVNTYRSVFKSLVI